MSSRTGKFLPHMVCPIGIIIEIALQHIREKQQLPDHKKHKKLYKDYDPQRLADSQIPEAIEIQTTYRTNNPP